MSCELLQTLLLLCRRTDVCRKGSEGLSSLHHLTRVLAVRTLLQQRFIEAVETFNVESALYRSIDDAHGQRAASEDKELASEYNGAFTKISERCSCNPLAWELT